MGAKGAAEIIFKNEINAAEDKAGKWKEKELEYQQLFANPYEAAARGFVDEVIRPSETRIKLIHALRMLENKVDKLPRKKHGNIPLSSPYPDQLLHQIAPLPSSADHQHQRPTSSCTARKVIFGMQPLSEPRTQKGRHVSWRRSPSSARIRASPPVHRYAGNVHQQRNRHSGGDVRLLVQPASDQEHGAQCALMSGKSAEESTDDTRREKGGARKGMPEREGKAHEREDHHQARSPLPMVPPDAPGTAAPAGRDAASVPRPAMHPVCPGRRTTAACRGPRNGTTDRT